MCEAFGCRPTEALEELDADAGLVSRILELRAAAQAHAAYKNWSHYDEKTKERLRGETLIAEVIALDFEDAQREIRGE